VFALEPCVCDVTRSVFLSMNIIQTWFGGEWLARDGNAICDVFFFSFSKRRQRFQQVCSLLESWRSQTGVHVPLGVHLHIIRGTFKVSNRREVYLHIFYFKTISHKSVSIIFKSPLCAYFKIYLWLIMIK